MIKPKHDLIDVIVDYVLAEYPQLSNSAQKIKDALRFEFQGEEIYIRRGTSRQQTSSQVQALFNGRNITKVASELQMSRATVYRILKRVRNSPVATK